MPIYEFACTDCGHGFERLQKLSDPDPAQCPACGHASVTRRLSAPSFRLAGSGWYETDFKTDKDRKRNLAGDDAPAKPAAPDAAKPDTAAKTDSKPAAKPVSSTPAAGTSS